MGTDWIAAMVVRHFLGWEQPLLTSAIRNLLALAGTQRPLDLSAVLVLVPTAQTGRRLRQGLAEAAGEGGILAPRVLTLEQFWKLAWPENAAGTLVRLAAWREVLMRPEARAWLLPNAESEELGELAPAQAETGEVGEEGFEDTLDAGRALQLARQLDGLREELADGLGEALDLGRAAAKLAESLDDGRWEKLAALEEQMRAQLAAWGRVDPYQVDLAEGFGRENAGRGPGLAAEKVAKSVENEAGAERWRGVERVVLLGGVDPGPRALRSLEALAGGAGGASSTGGERWRLESWIAAPEEEFRSFDSWGRPLAEAWKDRIPPLDGVKLRSVGRAEDLAAAAVDFLAEAGIASDEVAVGLGDPALAGELARALRTAGWESYDPQGSRAGVAAALPALRGLRALLDGGIEGLRELLALPGAEGLFPALEKGRTGHLAALNELWTEILPTDFGSLERGLRPRMERALKLPDSDEDEGTRARRAALAGQLEWVQRVLAEVVAWRKEFAAQPSGGLALQQLAAALGGVPDGADGAWWQALATAGEELASLEESGQRFAPALALELALTAMPAIAAAPPADGQAEIAVELSGWLELAGETAPWLVLAGLHEGLVPARGEDGPWLHDGIRERLGLRGRDWRLAVESLRLSQVLACRQPERVCILVCAEAPNGEARLPSRLLLRGEGGERVERILQLMEPEVPRAAALPPWDRGQGRLELPEPPPERLHWSGPLSPSKINAWLQCPLRFALKHVWKLERLEWLEHELGSRGFGRLAHAVLEDFARDEEVREWTDSGLIERWLAERLARLGRELLGVDPPLPARLQLESLRLRFGHFARWQARRRADGWRIVHAELEFGREEYPWELGGLPLRGIVDRIDLHPDHGWMIWDYKTRSNAKGEARKEDSGAGVDRNLGSTGVLRDEVHWANARDNGVYPAQPLAVGNKSKVWQDLQLPLYAARWQQEVGGVTPAVGQIALGTVLSAVGGYRWDRWTGDGAEEVQESAAAWAAGAVAGLRAGQYWPEGPHWAWKKDEFAALAPDGWEHALGPKTLAWLQGGAAAAQEQGSLPGAGAGAPQEQGSPPGAGAGAEAGAMAGAMAVAEQLELIKVPSPSSPSTSQSAKWSGPAADFGPSTHSQIPPDAAATPDSTPSPSSLPF